jgi:hypothetical protein
MAGFGDDVAELANVGWERELTGRAHASARGEREDVKDGTAAYGRGRPTQ